VNVTHRYPFCSVDFGLKKTITLIFKSVEGMNERIGLFWIEAHKENTQKRQFKQKRRIHKYTVSQKTSPTFLVVTRESIVGFS